MSGKRFDLDPSQCSSAGTKRTLKSEQQNSQDFKCEDKAETRSCLSLKLSSLVLQSRSPLRRKCPKQHLGANLKEQDSNKTKGSISSPNDSKT